MWVKILLISMTIYLCLSYSEGKSLKCKELEECVKGENDISCVKRYKRHCTGSSNSCNECDCEFCSTNTCSSTCNTCCANFVQPCSSSYCCYKTCHAQCASNTCRKSCRNSCTKKISTSKTESYSNIQSQQSNAVNITTVINLHNKINNTNEIDIPVKVNSTNYNNFTIDTANEYQGTYIGGGQSHIILPPQMPPGPEMSQQSTPPGSHPPHSPHPPHCCQVVGPRQCVPQPQFPFTKCFHLRRKQCGNVCSSSIMHAQQHQVCEEVQSGQQSCHNQLVYVPQPRTRCAYQPTWPYVSCGVSQPNCEGCYGGDERKQGCPTSCFQDQFARGGYFTPGPIGGDFGVNPAISGYPIVPNFDNSYSIMDTNKNDPSDSNAIVPDIEIIPKDNKEQGIEARSLPFNVIQSGITNSKEQGGLPIKIIQDGIGISEIPSSFIPSPIGLNPYGPYSPYPPVPYPPYSPIPYPPYQSFPAPYPFPFSPPQPSFSGIPIQEGEAPPLFSSNGYYHNKRGTNEQAEKNLTKENESAEEEKEEDEDNTVNNTT